MYKIIFPIALSLFFVSCQEMAEVEVVEDLDQAIEEAQQEEMEETQEEVKEAVAELDALHDESRKVEGAIQCLTEQIELVKQEKFDEALEYYTADRRKKIETDLAANIDSKAEWKAAFDNLPEAALNEWMEAIKKDPTFFKFEDGMWRRTDK